MARRIGVRTQSTYLKMISIRHILLLALASVAIGCGPAKPTSNPPVVSTSKDPIVAKVCSVVAKQMGVEASKVSERTSMADLGADELDLVELVMELEDEFKITISDEAITNLTGNDEWQKGASKLTVANLADIVRKARK